MTGKQMGAAVGAVLLAVIAPILTLALLHSLDGETQAAPGACTAPDNGSGTVTLPPLNCEYVAPDEPMKIINGLPPGTTIELAPILMDFFCTNPLICSMPLAPGECETAGGSLGGHGCCADATLDLTVTGTGSLAGFNRHLAVPVALEAHSGPRTPGDPVQTFPRDMYRLQGEITGDSDFDTLTVTAGTDFGLPSPGQTTLTQLPSGDFAVDSFFDITYQIEFVGSAGSQLDGYAGTTTATTRLQTGLGGPYDTLKWEQLPDLAATGLDVMAQIPEVNITLADDFQCTETGYITQIDFWGSWYEDWLPGGYPPDGDPEAVSFTLSLHSDVPAGVDQLYSHPGELLWLHTFLPGECQALLYAYELTEGWFYPPEAYYEPFADSMVWWYRCPIPEEYWFYQEEGTIYWLDVAAYPEAGSYFGWKTSLDHWNDDGTWASGAEPIDPSAWAELRYPPTHPMEGESIDLAFEIWGREAPVVQTNKWQQTPDLASTGMDVSANDPDFILADDFQCTTPGPVTEIDVWGSWLDDILPAGGADDVSFTLSIHEDVPAAGEEPSHPGELLWLWDSPQFTVRPYQVGLDEGWLEPPSDYTPSADTTAWKYTFNLDPAQYCTAPDNGSDTIDLPADCDYIAPGGPMEIIDGLPPGTTIELTPTFDDYVCNVARPWCTISLPSGVCEGSGGLLGGTACCAEAALDLVVTGTGSLAGFNRSLSVPMKSEFHWAPRTAGDPVQTFSADMYRLEGELFGDPDFCTFRVKAGRVNGLPGPGQTTLSEKASGDFAVDSFFDITYQIEFEGCPGSQIDGYAGTTTGMATIRYGPPSFVQQGTGEDPVVYWLDVQADSDEGLFGWKTSLDHWNDDGAWATEPVSPFCGAPDNGTGTAELPATEDDCEYIAPDEVMEIIDGLPPDTTIELDPIFDWFICNSPPCETPGGSLGGTVSSLDEATLDLTVTGTGDLTGFNRHLAVPMSPAEFHWGPRTPGDPEQTFSADMYRLFGELFGDPDFCEFRITAGTDYGLPSPGETTLTELPSGDFAVDSFFDVTYQIYFEGCPGSQIDGYAGTTTATVRLQIVESGWTGWSELVYPAGHSMVGESIDLAFEIWGREEPVVEETHKWRQSPDVDPTGMDVRANNPNFILADDFQCTTPGPITEILVWGSWLDDDLPAGGADDVSFTLSIHEDVPAAGEDPSHPGELLWLWDSPQFTVNPYQGGLEEGWLEPPADYTPSADTIAWEYTFNLDPAQYCTDQDNGGGTVELPADCDYVSPGGPMEIIDGLPPGTTIEMTPTLEDFDCSGSRTFCTLSPPLGSGVCEGSGGLLGGTASCADAALDLVVSGTGSLAGFNRHISVPMETEFHWADRTPGDPVQPFSADIYHFSGELFGDPDFCEFKIDGGTDYGQPSPGQTTLTELPSGDFAVDSFFDITYDIEFEGCPASQIDGYAGTTTGTATIRYGPATFIQQGTEEDPVIYWLDVQAENDGQALFGWKTSIDHWNDDGAWAPGTEPVGPLCHAPDNGTGTSELPATEDDCEYIAPDEVMEITDGLPPDTTIELDPIFDWFICYSPPCETPGGSLGGTVSSLDEATLDLTATGTGDLAGFNRHFAVPLSLAEFHWGPRTPGHPEQTFSADIYRLFGELFGDPDFCEFTTTAGTDFGMPSPGQTTLTELPSGDFAVDSFFDITYQIYFEGCPGSQLEDYSGTTTATVRIQLDVSEWSDLLYPPGHPMASQSIDLAFAIWGGCAAGSDPDWDGICDPGDNCPNTANTDQTDTDTDTVGDACDNCPHVSNPGQENADGDAWGNACDNCPATATLWEVPPGDTDCDGFTDVVEGIVGTDAGDDCPDWNGTPGSCPGPGCDGDDVWPPDLNVNTQVNLIDVLLYKPKLTGPYDARYDLNGDVNVNLLDVLLYKPFINKSCTNP